MSKGHDTQCLWTNSVHKLLFDRVQILETVLVYSNKDMAAQVVLYSYTIILNLENEETSIQFNF